MKSIQKSTIIDQYQLPIDICQEKEFFLATCPIWRDCYAQGKSMDEATAEIIAVATSLIELYSEEEKKIPLMKVARKPTRSLRERISFNVPIFISS